MMKLTGLTEREAMELAYGLLWRASIDPRTRDGRFTRNARLALGNALGFEGKKAGLMRTNEAVSNPPETA